MRFAKILPAFALVALLLPAMTTTAVAATVDVAMRDDVFDPGAVQVQVGDTVRWTNEGTDFHDTKSAETNPDGSDGVAWWDSPDVTPVAGTFSWRLTAAGMFPYHCTLHEGMTGTVMAVPRVDPPLGGMDTDFFVQVGAGDGDSDLVHDVQKRAPGEAGFTDWRMGVTSARIGFDPSSTGTFEFRSRLRRLSTNGASLYSKPASTLVVDEVVMVRSSQFMPNQSRIHLGSTVLWTLYRGRGNHTTTSRQQNVGGGRGVALWDSGRLGDSFLFRFSASGAFPYRCLVHSAMRGTVWVPLELSAGSGPVGATFRVRVATENAPSDLVYDIQMRAPGDAFRNWRMGVTQPRVQFRPLDPGTYQFRARLRRLSTGGVSLYSRTASIEVTSAVDDGRRADIT